MQAVDYCPTSDIRVSFRPEHVADLFFQGRRISTVPWQPQMDDEMQAAYAAMLATVILATAADCREQMILCVREALAHAS